MIPLKSRLLASGILWVITGLLFAFWPYEPNGYPELQERLGAFAFSPLLTAIGLTALFGPPHGSAGVLTFLGVMAYMIVLFAFTLGTESKRAFQAFCVVHLVQTVLAVV